MVGLSWFIMDNPAKMDDLWGYPFFRKNHHIGSCTSVNIKVACEASGDRCHQTWQTWPWTIPDVTFDTGDELGVHPPILSWQDMAGLVF